MNSRNSHIFPFKAQTLFTYARRRDGARRVALFMICKSTVYTTWHSWGFETSLRNLRVGAYSSNKSLNCRQSEAFHRERPCNTQSSQSKAKQTSLSLSLSLSAFFSESYSILFLPLPFFLLPLFKKWRSFSSAVFRHSEGGKSCAWEERFSMKCQVFSFFLLFDSTATRDESRRSAGPAACFSKEFYKFFLSFFSLLSLQVALF